MTLNPATGLKVALMELVPWLSITAMYMDTFDDL